MKVIVSEMVVTRLAPIAYHAVGGKVTWRLSDFARREWAVLDLETGKYSTRLSAGCVAVDLEQPNWPQVTPVGSGLAQRKLITFLKALLWKVVTVSHASVFKVKL